MHEYTHNILHLVVNKSVFEEVKLICRSVQSRNQDPSYSFAVVTNLTVKKK